jgi:hypothetical protein
MPQRTELADWQAFKTAIGDTPWQDVIFTDAKVPHPHNCLRHSFCTYHVAAFKNPGLTATILCHRNQGMLWARYNGNATQDQGKRYWTITPETASTLAE